jgi:hypothetical protein
MVDIPGLLSLGFLVHILLVNVMLGMAAIALAGGLGGKDDPSARAFPPSCPRSSPSR